MGLVFILCMIPIAIVIALVWLLRYKHTYWQRKNVSTVSVKAMYKAKEQAAFILQKVYIKLRKENIPYVGAYSVLSPVLLITDLDLIKTVYISEFQSFPDRGLYANYEKDPLSKNLLRLHGELWKKVRAKLTPTFTSGKMKMMFAKIETIGQRLVEVTRENVDCNGNEVELKDLCACFTTDVIGSVAFGLECNSLRDPMTEFRLMGNKAFHTINPLTELLCSEYPKIGNILGIKTFSKELIDFYSHIIKENIAYRKLNPNKYNDFLDLLIELMDSNGSDGEFHLDMEDVIAQAFVFFIGGFETTSSTISMAIYELVHNPLVQQKARGNIAEVLEKHGGAFTYDSIQEMAYIRQVVQETLRKHPVAPIGRRVCRRPFTLPKPGNLTIEPGVHMVVPIYAIHHDPEYYPEPEVFRPERFSIDDKNRRHPMTYLPFGAGPRMCIADRFGMMLSMLGVALLLKNFEFSPSARTPKSLSFDPLNTRVLSANEGFYFKVGRL